MKIFDETNAGWKKYEGNPVLGKPHGHCFDVSVLKEKDAYRMYFSWRPKVSIAMVESTDGLHWNDPVIVLAPRAETGWEKFVNRPVVLKKDGKYRMWYTGLEGMDESGHAWIGYAESVDGIAWERRDKPILGFEVPWEGAMVMCPHVIWDEEKNMYRMWYSGGGQWEPDSIGYAESPDGIAWKKHRANPILTKNPSNEWENLKVAGCQVVKHDGWHLMFYIGFAKENNGWRARIGLARSKDGITNWHRHPANPIISLGSKGAWDSGACYKPYAIYDNEKDEWMLWYNGGAGQASDFSDWLEQIGVAVHPGEDLGF